MTQTPRGPGPDQVAPPDLPSHIPSLDGLRAFSVALVLIGHVAATSGAPAWMDKAAIASLGNIGVRFFFLISGFLITTLLLRECARHGRIDLGQFYLRRAYRILPAALTYIGLIWLAYLAGWIDLRMHIGSRQQVESAIPDLLHALTFTANYQHDYNWYYNHLWSLSVEEQFYLIWPFVLVYAGLRRGAWVALGAVLLCPFIRWGMHAWGDVPEIALNREFQAIADALAMGCLAAILHTRISQMPRLRSFLSHPLLPLLAGGALIAFGYGSALVSRPFAYIGGQIFSNLGIIIILQHLVRTPGAWAGVIANWRPVTYIGGMSYSLYLWQEPFLYFYVDTWATRFPQNLALSFMAAWLSYKLVEQPFLRLKDRLHGKARPPKASA
jgi:peptidoglycan/LPS O-acetylase OafA/YrhL